MIGHHTNNIIHLSHLKAGLAVVKEISTGGLTNTDWSVVCYSDGSRWLFTNEDVEECELLGDVSDSSNRAEILETQSGGIIALYPDSPKRFETHKHWIESLVEEGKVEARKLSTTGFFSSSEN